MPSPSGPPIHASTRLWVGSITAAALTTVLWSALTAGHPVLTGSSFSLCALVLLLLGVLFAAALPQRPGVPPTPERSAPFAWLPWPFALLPLLSVSAEPRFLPWLWPLLLLPLTALLLAFLAARARRRAGSDAPRGHPTRAAQRFGTAALTTALVSLTLHMLLTNEALIQSGPSFSFALFILVAVLVVQILQGVARTLPPGIAGSGKPPANGAVFVWLAWPMVPLAALPIATYLVHPVGPSSLWPLGLLPLGALGFAVLSTRGYSRERAERAQKGESV